jgi:phosphopantothenoylcysteine synthetase/decarboxylase
MNTFMWESPFTSDHLSRLERLGVTVIPPVGKRLACGDVGLGAMAAPEAIAAACVEALRRRGGGKGAGGDGGEGEGDLLLLPAAAVAAGDGGAS